MDPWILKPLFFFLWGCASRVVGRDDVSGSFCWRRLRSIWCDSCVWAPLKRHTDGRNAVEPKVGRLYHYLQGSFHEFFGINPKNNHQPRCKAHWSKMSWKIISLDMGGGELSGGWCQRTSRGQGERVFFHWNGIVAWCFILLMVRKSGKLTSWGREFIPLFTGF